MTIVLEAQESRIRGLADLVSGEGSLSASCMVPSLYPHQPKRQSSFTGLFMKVEAPPIMPEVPTSYCHHIRDFFFPQDRISLCRSGTPHTHSHHLPLPSTSPSAGITRVSHHSWLALEMMNMKLLREHQHSDYSRFRTKELQFLTSVIVWTNRKQESKHLDMQQVHVVQILRACLNEYPIQTGISFPRNVGLHPDGLWRKRRLFSVGQYS